MLGFSFQSRGEPMTEAENIVSEHLRHIRGVVDATREDIREIKGRLGYSKANTRTCRTASIGSTRASSESSNGWN